MSERNTVSDSRVVEILTAFAPLSNFCPVGGAIYFLNRQGNWARLLLENNAVSNAAPRVLSAAGVPQFESPEQWSMHLSLSNPGEQSIPPQREPRTEASG